MGWKEQRMCPGSASWFPYITCRNICPSAWIPCWGRVLRRSRSSWSMTVRRTRRGPSAILMRSGIAGSGSSTNGMPGSAEPAMRVFGLRAAGIWVSWTATTGWIAIFAGHCTGGGDGLRGGYFHLFVLRGRGARDAVRGFRGRRRYRRL